MSCELYDDVLDDYVDGGRSLHGAGGPNARLAAFESHLAGCERCQALVADFMNIRRAASALDEHLPPARLWATIASAIEHEERKPWWERSVGNTFSAWVPVAVAASLTLLLAGAAWLARLPVASSPTPAVAQQPGDPAMKIAEQHYEQAIAGLQEIATTQNGGLDPDTRAVLQANLAVIDHAIKESRAALSTEPTSALAQESLLDALDTKVALLQDTVALGGEIGAQSTDASSGAAEERNQ
jgi:hypothetical protein